MARRVTPLRLAIAASGRTQRDIASKIGVGEDQLSRIVNGLHADKDTQDALARELGQTIDDLWPTAPPERAA